MTTDRDLSADLPAAPPPRPDRREASIAAAMRCFDGAEPADRPRPSTPAGRWRIGRPQIGALVTVALVAAIGLPVWLSGDVHNPPVNPAPSRSAVEMVARPLPSPNEAAPSTVSQSRPDQVNAAPPIVAQRSTVEVSPPPLAAKLPGEGPAAETSLAAPPAMAAAAPPPPPPPSPPPPPPAPAMTADVSGAEDITVTGSRVRSAVGERAASVLQRPREPAARGAWTACTVNDAARNLAACRGLTGSTIPGSVGRATTLVGEGIARAWGGDIDAAIMAFDRAIDIAPRLAPAYLNRGLAYARKGDGARALADLDRAIRNAPDDPRGYRGRSLVLRQRGDSRKADADERRAAELDQDSRQR